MESHQKRQDSTSHYARNSHQRRDTAGNPSRKFKAKSHLYNEYEKSQRHHSQLGAHAAQLWKIGKVTDITVQLGERVFHAHRPVLSCYSKYFRELLINRSFDEPSSTIEISIPITAEAFDTLLGFMYTGDLKLTCQNIGDVYVAAQQLMMQSAIDWCMDILTGVSKPQVQPVYIYATAKKLNEGATAERSLRTMAYHFERIVGTQEFVDLTCEEVCEYLSYNELAVRSEVVVYVAALKWLNYKFLDREKDAEAVISCVRFPLMTINEVLACHCPPILPGIVEVPAIKQMLLKATCYVAARSLSSEKLFKQYSCEPRTYLVERTQLVLWDPNIFDPERHAQYRRETAATKIQANYKGFKIRQDLSKRSYDYDEFRDSRNASFTTEDLVEKGNGNKLDTVISSMPDSNVCDHIFDEDFAATKIQANYRGYRARNELEQDNIAATTIQANYRGYRTRHHLQPNPLFSGESSDSDNTDSSSNLENRIIVDVAHSETLKTLNPRPLPQTPVIIVFGGINANYHVKGVETDKNMLMYTPESDEWTEFDEVMEARNHSFIANIHETIYVIGGCDPEMMQDGVMIPTKKCLAYNLETRVWTTIAEMNYSRMYHGAAVSNDTIYVVGGRDENDVILDSIEYYDTVQDRWFLCHAKLPTPRMGIAVCDYDDKLWIAGGMEKVKAPCGKKQSDSLILLYEVLTLNHITQELSGETPLPNPQSFSTLVSCNGKLFIIGGTSYVEGQDAEKLSSIAQVFTYSTSDFSWENSAPLPLERHLSSAVTIGDCIYLINGISTASSGIALNDNLLWDQNMEIWRALAPLPATRMGISAAAVHFQKT